MSNQTFPGTAHLKMDFHHPFRIHHLDSNHKFNLFRSTLLYLLLIFSPADFITTLFLQPIPFLLSTLSLTFPCFPRGLRSFFLSVGSWCYCFLFHWENRGETRARNPEHLAHFLHCPWDSTPLNSPCQILFISSTSRLVCFGAQSLDFLFPLSTLTFRVTSSSIKTLHIDISKFMIPFNYCLWILDICTCLYT